MRTLVYECAKEWGVPPWQVVSSPAKWFYRWIHERSLRAQLENPTVYDDD